MNTVLQLIVVFKYFSNYHIVSVALAIITGKWKWNAKLRDAWTIIKTILKLLLAKALFRMFDHSTIVIRKNLCYFYGSQFVLIIEKVNIKFASQMMVWNFILNFVKINLVERLGILLFYYNIAICFSIFIKSHYATSNLLKLFIYSGCLDINTIFICSIQRE